MRPIQQSSSDIAYEYDDDVRLRMMIKRFITGTSPRVKWILRIRIPFRVRAGMAANTTHLFYWWCHAAAGASILRIGHTLRRVTLRFNVWPYPWTRETCVLRESMSVHLCLERKGKTVDLRWRHCSERTNSISGDVRMSRRRPNCFMWTGGWSKWNETLNWKVNAIDPIDWRSSSFYSIWRYVPTDTEPASEVWGRS